MQYLLAIYDSEQRTVGWTNEQMEQDMAEWFKFDSEIRKAVNVIGGDALHPTQAATTVRHQNGKAITTDGPFAETKEQLGGYYVVDVDNLDTALEWAAKMPNLPGGGSVEVRPIMVFDQ